MQRKIFTARIILTHILYVIYSTILWWKLTEVSTNNGNSKTVTQIVMVLWTVLFVLGHCCLAFCALKPRTADFLQKMWWNVPMFFFISFNLPPYGYTLHGIYDVTGTTSTKSMVIGNETCIIPIVHHVSMADFITLQMVMPLLMVTFIVYPLPKRAYDLPEYLAIAVEFMNAFDIMDMISDIYFIKNYGLFWIVLFYIAMGVSSLLISFPIKIENDDLVWPNNVVVCAHSDFGLSTTSILEAPVVFETDFGPGRTRLVSFGSEIVVQESLNKITNKIERKVSITQGISTEDGISTTTPEEKIEDKSNLKKVENDLYKTEEVKVWKKIFKALLTMIFMDFSFAAIRFKIMVTEDSAEHGFNMCVKNLILLFLHGSYLLQHVKHMLVRKLEREAQA